MKKITSLLIVMLSTITMISCESNEDRALSLINNEMKEESSVVNEFISITVDSTMTSVYTDPIIMDMVAKSMDLVKKEYEYMNSITSDMNTAKSIVSSNYSESLKILEKVKKDTKLFEENAKKKNDLFKEIISSCDLFTPELCWKAKYKCKINMQLVVSIEKAMTITYFLDKDMKTILYQYNDLVESEYSDKVKLIDDIISKRDSFK